MRYFLGIELGSTRIKAVAVDADARPVAQGSHTWENQLVDGLWTYSLDEVWTGVQDAVSRLADDVGAQGSDVLSQVAGIGVSAMMHGYLPFDASGHQLAGFRTWRNTNTGAASEALSQALGCTIPLRWSIAHLYQAVLDDEAHIPQIAHLTTLAGYVHWRLTGERVLGVGDASGMFPIDSATCDWDERALSTAQRLFDVRSAGIDVRSVLPRVLVAGQSAGTLTEEGARLLDPSGRIRPGTPCCPPEGDAGTGMVATNAVAPRTGNVSAGTSIFAMVTLERPLPHQHPEIDLVTTPAGAPVAMVHCNNGASEIDAWARVFGQFADRAGFGLCEGQVFGTLFKAALDGEPDGGGLLAYNYLAGEPITGQEQGRPLVVRTPDSRLTLPNLARTLIMSAFATLSLGMRMLTDEGVHVDEMRAQGGIFATPGVAQRLLAAALGVPVAVAATASEGGAWGMAVLAAYAVDPHGLSLADFLAQVVFAHERVTAVGPDPDDALGFGAFLDAYRRGLAIQRVAVTQL